MSVRRRLVIAALVVYWLALIGGTHWPREFFPEAKLLLSRDKLVHGVAYAGLGFLLGLLVCRRRTRDHALVDVWNSAIFACLIISASGLIDEATQPLVGRDFEWYDWISDSVGAVGGAILAIFAVRALSAFEQSKLTAQAAREASSAPPR